MENLELKLGEKSVPERIELEHIKSHGNSELTSEPLNGLILVEQLKLVIVHIQVVRRSFFGDRAFTAVACDELSALAEGVDCKAAVVVAQAAVCHLNLVDKAL